MASGVFKNVTKSEPCPICGGTDWCSWFPRRDGNGYLLSCKRACRDGYGNLDVAGKDGKMYRFISEKNNQYIYGECQTDRECFDGSGRKPKARLRYVGKVRPAGDTTLDCVYRTILKNLHLEDRHRGTAGRCLTIRPEGGRRYLWWRLTQTSIRIRLS